LSFKGPMLLKGIHDHVRITVLKNVIIEEAENRQDEVSEGNVKTNAADVFRRRRMEDAKSSSVASIDHAEHVDNVIASLKTSLYALSSNTSDASSQNQEHV